MLEATTALPADPTEALTAARIDEALAQVAAMRAGVGAAIIGQETVVDLVLATVMAGGHGLLVGVPGLAKTRLVEAIGTACGLDWKRIQFTPDLMPADILGAEILQTASDGSRAFRFEQGPIFASLLMADEINRASPRTQSALLQAMQEQHVTVAGTRYDLPQPFHVLATQNPIEQEGTYPLPEAQLDRFLLQIDVPYPDRETERKVLLATVGDDGLGPRAAVTTTELMSLQALVRSMPVPERLLDAALDIVRLCRPDDPKGLPVVKQSVAWGPGPRAGQALLKAAKAVALLRGRVAPTMDDLSRVVRPALVHRMALSWQARADGGSLAAIADAVADHVLTRTV
jgi:MoxR-like ATPase